MKKKQASKNRFSKTIIKTFLNKIDSITKKKLVNGS